MKDFLELKNGYRFDRLIFKAAFALMGVFLLLVLLKTGMANHYFMECSANSNGWCENPYIDSFGGCSIDDKLICSTKTLPPGGSVGERPPWYIRNEGYIVFLLVAAAFALNHFIYNRRFATWKKLS
jgi:hypothetical protein